ncbi:response regulator transcription factor [Desulfosporosinus acidiphilus]|uniref:response regulator transcription factor n=1 Tax=Desulfosporosinus acidiphilus TaxID=885581 RepID=UPI000257A648|nr:response regulator transcription factor [Desulfosporosinus acidiphilus]
MEDAKLTEMERLVLKELVNGGSNKIIAQKLFLSEKTVKNHLSSIYKKLNVKNRTNAAVKCIESPLLMLG